MPRTISQLTAGTTVYVDETVSGTLTHVPYYYLGLDEGGNARLLRQYLLDDNHKMVNAAGDAASYSGGLADTYLENTTDGFLARLDANTINALNYTSIAYVDFNQDPSGTAQLVTISRRCFLLSYTEMGGAATAAGSEGQSYLTALKTATGQSADNNARIGYTETGATAAIQWLRSGYSATQFRYVAANGALNYGGGHNQYKFRPALSVNPNTAVSDEGAESIFLLPDGRVTTWNVQAEMSLGQTAQRPSKCKVIVPADTGVTVTTLQACNNYGDASPTWVNVAADGTATLGDTKTGENWELGVKLVTAANAPSKTIGEPAMIVQFAEV